jgi:hypothetical protein
VSPTNIAYYTIPAVGSNTGNASSSFVFNVIPPSNEAVLARMIRIRMTFQVQVLKDLLRYDDPKKLIRGTLSESPCAMDNKRL